MTSRHRTGFCSTKQRIMLLVSRVVVFVSSIAEDVSPKRWNELIRLHIFMNKVRRRIVISDDIHCLKSTWNIVLALFFRLSEDALLPVGCLKLFLPLLGKDYRSCKRMSVPLLSSYLNRERTRIFIEKIRNSKNSRLLNRWLKKLFTGAKIAKIQIQIQNIHLPSNLISWFSIRSTNGFHAFT